jgi:hypothetical protein
MQKSTEPAWFTLLIGAISAVFITTALVFAAMALILAVQLWPLAQAEAPAAVTLILATATMLTFTLMLADGGPHVGRILREARAIGNAR